MTDFRALCAELVAIEDAFTSGKACFANQGQALDGFFALAAFRDVAVRARAALTEPVPDGSAVPDGREPTSVTTHPTDKELIERIETLEAAAQKHIAETSANILALASRIEALESAKRQSSKVLDLSDLPQWTPEQVQRLKDLLGGYRNHLGLNE